MKELAFLETDVLKELPVLERYAILLLTTEDHLMVEMHTAAEQGWVSIFIGPNIFW